MAFVFKMQRNRITVHCVYVQKTGCSSEKCSFIEYVAAWHNEFSASILTNKEQEANGGKRGVRAGTNSETPNLEPNISFFDLPLDNCDLVLIRILISGLRFGSYKLKKKKTP